MILFIASAESDYLQDLTYAGLSQVLGAEQVVDFPLRWQYRRERKHFWSAKEKYPRNLGFRPGSAAEHSFGSAEKVRQALRANEFKTVILSSAKPETLAVFEKYFDDVRVPWVFIDGGDWKEIGGDFKRLGGQAVFDRFLALCKKNPPAAIFKRELPIGSQAKNVFPLPFSINAALVPALPPSSEKDTEVLFWAVESSETRKRAFQILKGNYDCDHNGSIPGQKFRKYLKRGQSYFEALNRAKVALSFRGEGFDTLRFWEIPACGGLLLSETPEIQIPQPFVHGKTAVFCKSDLSDLRELIDYYLANPREAMEISRAGQKHLLAHHTSAKRAKYIMEVLKTEFKISLE